MGVARRLILLEPSKVGHQHATLIAGYARALVSASDALPDQPKVEAWVSRSVFDNLPQDLQSRIHHRNLPVMDPVKRRLARKSALEFATTLWSILRKRREDIMVVTCLLSPALYLLELACRLRGPRGVFITLHSEVEALVDPTLRTGITTYGYWCRKWWAMRRPTSRLNLLVIGDHIRRGLLALPKTIPEDQITTVAQPFETGAAIRPERTRQKPRVCFIGYRSELKGFATFETLAKRRTEFDWVEIGAGRVHELASGSEHPLHGNLAFQNAIADCDIALFPYLQGYDVALSAALMDAVAANLHVIASDRGVFTSFAEIFGKNAICCYRDPDEIDAALDAYLAEPEKHHSADRQGDIQRSAYSQAEVNQQMTRLISEPNSRIEA